MMSIQSIVWSICYHFSNSYTHFCVAARFMSGGRNTGQHLVKKMEIGKFSDTQWSCQAKQFDSMWKRIDIVYEVLQDVIDDDSNTNRTTEPIGYLLRIDRRFIGYLLITKHILKKEKFASDILQKPTNDLSGAIDLIGTLKDEIGACSARELCQKFWD
ncbi:Zinc finger MYM-type protein 1-like [Oopsacas minuta]|uniref:Zinc finger MYM-type protein 1-like n=1 Tax=Oopsacas minuta TaxID=111878 RepID=A0AAV7KD47_9METZ|nr:Zinc finger MYM-type protein 1-like [Oopsacas minuta]